jgi:hypothetical protein
MQLRIQITAGGEVNWAGQVHSGPIYYGGPPPQSGQWKLSMPRIEDYLCAALGGVSYGDSIETFVLGYEIGELEGWGSFFTSTAHYASYRPKMKTLLSVGQLNWPDVKDLSAQEQFAKFSETLLDAIWRVKTMKRRPKNFDIVQFAIDVAALLKICSVEKITA